MGMIKEAYPFPDQTKVTVPEGKSGAWAVQRFTIDQKDRFRAFLAYRERAPYEGTYTRLVCGRTVVMSDTDAEMRDHFEPLYQAYDLRASSVRIHGLGLGMLLSWIMQMRWVQRIVVVEKDRDVVKLVWPHYAADRRLELIEGDALLLRPVKTDQYDVVWHDIWVGYSDDQHEESKLLHRRWGRHCKWQGSWGRNMYRR